VIGWGAWTGAAGAAAGAAEAGGVDAAAASVMACGGAALCTSGWDGAIGALAAPVFMACVRPRESSDAGPAGCEGVSGVDGVVVVGKFVDGMDGEAGVESPLMGVTAVGALGVGNLEDGTPEIGAPAIEGNDGCPGCGAYPASRDTNSS
jgi:hypothetical protein